MFNYKSCFEQNEFHQMLYHEHEILKTAVWMFDLSMYAQKVQFCVPNPIHQWANKTGQEFEAVLEFYYTYTDLFFTLSFC